MRVYIYIYYIAQCSLQISEMILRAKPEYIEHPNKYKEDSKRMQQ